ncbi:MAG TPA: asparagine synthase (glutamine-hydrolyzing) [Gemmatimonadaceae bacterium]
MCGITGALGLGADTMLASRMNRCLAHRGPDDEGISPTLDARGATVGAFAQRRLAIIDLSPGGHQPMVREDGRYVLVFNGEIYNYKELRAALEREGARFTSDSDTEVVITGLARHGHEFVGRLRGMFAFAFWDRDASRALLARDPFGIKPLFIGERDGAIAFASELRALLTGGFASRVVDAGAVAAYLAWGSVPEPAAMLRGATMLPAGVVAEVVVRGGRAESPRLLAQYTPFSPGGTSIDQGRLGSITDPRTAAETILAALRDSVAHHLIADVPVALFLSGGIDSSVVCALATEVSETKLDSFTIAFAEQEFTEAAFARAAAEKFGTRHHEIPLSGDDFFASLDAAFGAMDQPSMDGLNTYVVSRAVRAEGIKVVLSGLGGDEVFAGYPSFARARAIGRWWPVLRAARAPLRAATQRLGVRGAKLAALLREGSAPRAAYGASRLLFPEPMVLALTGRLPGAQDVVAPYRTSPLGDVSWYELTGYMRNTLLRDSDVFAMANSLELRVPFVDREVVAASLAVADALKLERGMSKPLLIRALGDRLPRAVWDRPKQGFALPFARWMLGPLRAEVESALTNPARVERVGLRGGETRRVWEQFASGRGGVTWSRPWAIYTLVRWAETVGVEVGAGVELPLAGGAPAMAS